MGLQNLPVELLTKILNLVIPARQDFEYFRCGTCLRLRLVSRVFSNIILNILFHNSSRFALIQSKVVRPDTIAWLLSTKVRLDRPGVDKTSTYIHQWATLMEGRQDGQKGNAMNYDMWLDVACRAAIHESGPAWVREYLVKSTDGVTMLGLDPSSFDEISTLESSTSSRGQTADSKIPHGAIQLACAAGDAAAVKCLLSNGADPVVRHPLFGVPLYNSVWSGDVTVVRCLFECGMSIHPREGYATLKRLAVRQDHSAVFKYLMENTPGEDFDFLKTCMGMACQNGNKEIVTILNEWSGAEARPVERPRSWVEKLGIRLAIRQSSTTTRVDPGHVIKADKRIT